MLSFQPNLTITKNGGHPDVPGKLNKEGVRLMPYYLVFNPVGRLVKHHLAGPYHGGDGSTMIQVVDRLLAEMPVIYLGRTRFAQIPELASQVAAGKHLGAAVKKLDRGLAGEPDAETRAELQKLLGLVTRYRDRRLVYVASLEDSDPARVLPELKHLAKEFKGTSLAGPIDARLAEAGKSKTLAAALELQKQYLRIRKRYESVKPKKRTEEFIEKIEAKLEALLEKSEGVLFAEVVRVWMEDM